MKKETRMISLSILAILTLCLLNVATASTINPATAPRSKIVTDVKAKQTHYELTFNAPQVVYYARTFNVSGTLTADGTGVSGAHIDSQEQNPKLGGWWTFGNGYTTDSNGNYYGWMELGDRGEHFIRANYDAIVAGDSVMILVR
ncbi:MAG: hypothetical protein WCE81_03770 [Halobacteriota archaeon]